MWLKASCMLEFYTSVPTPFILMLRPRSGEQQWISREDYVLSPSVPAVEFTDSEVNQQGYGVCRDMAHLGIACCRALCIPARMVVGYLEGLYPMDLHAWFEAYVGNRWYTFDPTQTDLKGGRVAIAFGRDATDVAIYTQFGAPVELLSMDVQVEQVSKPNN